MWQLRARDHILATMSVLFVLLFIPIVVAAPKLYVWLDPPASLGKEILENIAHKRAYLNFGGFVWRAVVYFVIWLVFSELLYRDSMRQDEDAAPHWTASSRRLGSVGLPLAGFAATFAAFDWLMSLNPTWYSTLFGVYFITGFFVASLALLILIVTFARDPFGVLAGKAHFHNLGKLLLAFVAFWGYIAFSQYMLMYHANLPEEVPWFLVRTRGAWRPVAVLLVFGHFLLPFFALLSRDLKLKPKALSVIAAPQDGCAAWTGRQPSGGAPARLHRSHAPRRAVRTIAIETFVTWARERAVRAGQRRKSGHFPAFPQVGRFLADVVTRTHDGRRDRSRRPRDRAPPRYRGLGPAGHPDRPRAVLAVAPRPRFRRVLSPFRALTRHRDRSPPRPPRPLPPRW